MHTLSTNQKLIQQKLIKHVAGISAMLLMILGTVAPSFVAAQTARINHSIVYSKIKAPPANGRDMWFALLKNYEDQPGKYFQLYVTSPVNTVVHVESAQGSKVLPVQANKVATFNIPLGWEMKTSSEIEDKGIRVYSKDADLACYLMSHNPYTSDGFYIIPNIGWGTDYVVAGFASLFEGFGSFVYDYPSEFLVVANQDKTIIAVTPTGDVRGAGPNIVAHAGNKTFSEQLNRGQAVQYQLVQAQDADNYDVTGSRVTSNLPVGVIGGSTCPNIPVDFPYCDHVCDMIPPVRTWATTYYSSNFFQTDQGHDASTCLVIGSHAGQTINRYDAKSGAHVFCILDHAYDHNFQPDVTESSRWSSDYPFLLVQYINSSTYPNGNNGNGDPAEVVINPVEQYFKKTIFQTPTSVGAQSPYINYVNVVVNEKAKNTTFDGQNIKRYTKQIVDGIYGVYRIPNVQPGAHTVISDSGAGVYIYGYGFDESYAWTGAFGNGTFHSPDTIPPVAIATGICFDAHVALSDVGPLQTKLGQIRVDTAVNMNYMIDPTWAEGKGVDSSFYDMFVTDITQPALLIMSVFDLAGNQTIITSTYAPQTAALHPKLTDFGIGNLTGPAILDSLYLVNTGAVPFKVKNVTLALGTQGFSLVGNPDLSNIKVGDSVKLYVSFLPVKGQQAGDTVIVDDGCQILKARVIGSGGAPDFSVTDDDFGHKPDKISVNDTVVVIKNLSNKVAIQIDQITTDSANFTLTNSPINALPFTLAPSASKKLVFTWKTNGPGPHFGHAYFTSNQISTTKHDSLYGVVDVPSETFVQDIFDTLDCATPGDSLLLQFNIQSTGTANAKVTGLVHGTDPHFRNLSAAIGTQKYDFSKRDTANLGTSASGVILNVGELYYPSASTGGTFQDSITAYDADGNIIKTVYAHIVQHYREAQVDQTTLTFPTVPYGSGLNPTPQSVNITNTAKEDLLFSSVTLMPGPYASFSVEGYYQNGTKVTPPVTLAPGQSITVKFNFDASNNSDAAQTAQFGVLTNSCLPIQARNLVAGLSYASALITGGSFTPISACSNSQIKATVTNTDRLSLKDDVVSAVVSGPDAANFTIPNNIVGMTVPSNNGTLDIPITFIPTAKAGSTNYSASLDVVVKNSKHSTTLHYPLSGTGVSVDLVASSMFAKKSADGQSTVTLPVTITVDKHGLTDPLVNQKITGIRLHYTLNSNLLNIKGSDPSNVAATQAAIAAAFSGANGWSVDGPNSSLNGNNLTLTLKNPNALDDATVTSGTLGALNFQVTLPQFDTMSNVALTGADLLQASSGGYAVIQGCASATTVSSTFGLIYQCGDSVIQMVMNGKMPTTIKPASPNPATGSTIKFTYATNIEIPMTIEVFDVLGNVVGIPVDHVMHAPGVYSVNFNISNLPSGTYTYRVSSLRYQNSKQFVVNH